MSHKHLFYCLTMFLIWSSCRTGIQMEEYGVISPSTAQELMDRKEDLIIIDVRTSTEVAGGQIPGALNIDIKDPEFEQLVKDLERDREYLVYCAKGIRSALAVTKMKELGFEKLYDLGGGFNAWNGK